MAVEEKSDNPLYKPLKLELSQLDKLCSKMMIYITDEIYSWRFPGKLCEDINCMEIISEYSKEDKYTLHLELLIDRLHVILNLAMHFLQNNPAFKQSIPFLKQPWTINLLSNNILQALLDSQESVNDLKHVKQKTQYNPEFQTQNTQTDKGNITICDSCNEAQSFIIRLLNEIELYCIAYNITSSIAETREKINEEIFDITKIGIMNKLISAISYDLLKIVENLSIHTKVNKLDTFNKYTNTEEYMSKDLFKLKIKCVKLSTQIELGERSFSKIENLERNIEKCNQNVTVFEDQCTLLHKNLINFKNSNKELKGFNESLIKVVKSHERERINVHLKLEDLKSTVSDFKRKTDKLEEENFKLKSQFNTLNDDKEDLITEQETWKTNYKSLLENNHLVNNEKNLLYKKLLELKYEYTGICKKWHEGCGIIKAMNSTAVNIEEQCKETLDKIQKCYKNKIDFQSTTIKKFQSQLSRCDKILKLSDCKEDTKVQGDPVMDMEEQYEANLLSISILEQRNIDLRKIIDRIKNQTN